MHFLLQLLANKCTSYCSLLQTSALPTVASRKQVHFQLQPLANKCTSYCSLLHFLLQPLANKCTSYCSLLHFLLQPLANKCNVQRMRCTIHNSISNPFSLLNEQLNFVSSNDVEQQCTYDCHTCMPSCVRAHVYGCARIMIFGVCTVCTFVIMSLRVCKSAVLNGCCVYAFVCVSVSVILIEPL